MTAAVPASAVGLKVGSKAQAVRPVQAYLEKYGYLEGPQSPFQVDDVHMRSGAADHLLDEPLASISGVFDEASVEALRHFQRFAGLEPTGELDEPTREKMNSARCGNPDTSPTVEGAALDEFVTGAGKWSTTNLTYSFQNYTPDLPQSTVQWAIDQAFGMWSAETPLRFRRVADGTSGDIVIRFVAGDHGDGSPFDGASGVLAHAFYPSNSGPIRGDSHFDEAETWTLNIPTGGGIDLVTVAAHEFGHALGLKHSADSSALMAPFYGGPRRFLSTDDILGIQSLYGGPGALENATWIHGNAALIEHPGNVESQRYYGFYNRVIGKANTTNWIHFALPTPVIEDGRRLNLDRFMLRAVMGRSATLRDVHIRDGERVVALHNGVNLSGSQGFAKFGVASVPDVLWGVSVSLGYTFGSGRSSDRRVDLISAGFDYKA
jgi:peptidoglycan hydrolase-like protein with peptidoglycan-binding domain